MRIRLLLRLSLLFLIPLIFLTSGCSTTASLTKKVLPASIARKILPASPNLKKRIMVFPFVDQAGVGSERTTQMSMEFLNLLKKSPNLLIYAPPDGVFSSLAMNSPQFGVIMSSKLIDLAENLGMNAIITGALSPVEASIRKTGLWPFDKWRKIYGISVAVNVVDITTKTLMLTHIQTEEFPIPLDEADDYDEEKIIDEASAEDLPEMIEDQASIVEDKLNEVPWTGKVLAVDDNTVMINAGKELGLQPGKCFDVYTPGKLIPSGSGRPIHLFGEKTGEIKVTSVMEKHALAEPVKGGPFMAKQVIRIRP